jgi:primosomal protein N'
MQDWILFAATCPKCQQQVLQHGYSRVLLCCFLDVDHPIEAYCATCDEFWPISAEERRAILAALSPALPETREVRTSLTDVSNRRPRKAP